MAFSFTTDIFNYMDTVTKEFVASNLGIVISTISPVIGLALICKLTLDGLFTLARPHGEPLSSLIKKFIVWSMSLQLSSKLTSVNSVRHMKKKGCVHNI